MTVSVRLKKFQTVSFRGHDNYVFLARTSKSYSNPTTKPRSIVSLHRNIVACLAYPEKFTRDDVVAPFSHLSVVVVTLPSM